MRICAFTSTRADYGLLYWTLKAIQADPQFDLDILCSGTHLCQQFGMTYKEIERDGFRIAKKCEMVLASDSTLSVAKSMALGLSGYAEALTDLGPDILLLLGDRYEALAAACAATLLRIPIAHCHGGELTFGAVDEAFRHAISKMSHLHFCSTAQSRRRLIQLGERPEHVYQVGALGVENINRLKLLSATEVESILGLPVARGLLTVTYHPATLEQRASTELFGQLLEALALFPEKSIVFTYPNADADGAAIIELIDKFVSENSTNRRAFSSLGQLGYLSCLSVSEAVVGNSSSGILEAPSLGIATVNVGQRQAGRERAESIIDCDTNWQSIQQAINLACSPDFQASLGQVKSPYGVDNASEKILSSLRLFEPAYALEKHFHDIS